MTDARLRYSKLVSHSWPEHIRARTLQSKRCTNARHYDGLMTAFGYVGYMCVHMGDVFEVTFPNVDTRTVVQNCPH